MFGLETPVPLAMHLFWDLGIIGLVLIAVQAVLALAFGHHGDTEAGDGPGIPWSNFLSLKTVAAMFIGIGFGGAAFGQNGFSTGVALAGGMVIGMMIAFTLVGVMRGFHRMRSDGTAQLWEAIGQRAKVYMRIPGEETAPGEIQVAFGGRLVNVQAFTRGPELPTGTDVLVISVHGEHALEVEKVTHDQLKLN